MKRPSTNSTGNSETPAERERRIRQRLRDDFEHYAKTCLKITVKDDSGEGGALAPLLLNRAQRFLHQRAEEQLRRTGKVRRIGVKGRQQGFSTYVEGRAMWKVTHRRGFNAFILTHKDDSTKILFRMAKRYYDNLPALVKPEARNDNANELSFGALDSGYKVATAGGSGSGRGDMIKFFHWSEVAFSPNAEENARGALQTVPDAPGTEIWMESTSDGPGNYFHRTCLSAINGDSDFEFDFVPWYWQEEYVADVPDDFVLTDDEMELLAVYGGPQVDGGPGLSLANLSWRRKKIAVLGGLEAFTREYPNSVEEAFAASAGDKLINPLLVQAAKVREVEPADVFPIWGLDPAWKQDNTALCKRQGNVVLASTQNVNGKAEKVAALVWRGLDTMATAGRVVEEYEQTPLMLRPTHVVIDVIGIGAGVAHRLREVFEEKGWDRQQVGREGIHPGTAIVSVNVGEAASQSDRYLRLRSELAFRAADWFEAKDCAIPDDEPFTQEVCAPTKGRSSAGKQFVEEKDKTKKTLGRSPDRWDSFMHTFFVTPQPRVSSRPALGNFTRTAEGGDFRFGGGGGWMSRM